MVRYVVDTHALLWFIADDPRLGHAADIVLQDSSSDLILPVTALAEACWIAQRGKVSLPLKDVWDAIRQDFRITIVPLTEAIVDRSNSCVSIGEMHDRQIVATALLLKDQGDEVYLLTKDENITESGLIPVLW